MPERYTIKQLQKGKGDNPDYLSDIQLIRMLINERRNKLTNSNAPLAQRLSQLAYKINDYANEGLEIEDLYNRKLE
jgi:hypothetical protein